MATPAASMNDQSPAAPLELSDSTRGLVLSLAEAGSFLPGRADLTVDAKRVMRTMADTIRELPNPIRVEGHTDDVPIHGPLFASNWELSTARATRVVQFLIEECGVDPMRLSAAGYAEFRPRMANDTAEARARNRRVDLVFLDAAAAVQEPVTIQP
ncbi:MAG: OmpA family protein [Acidobacteriota bacterium]